jgi:hypothetical protein
MFPGMSTLKNRHCEERGDEALHKNPAGSAGLIGSPGIATRNEHVFRGARMQACFQKGIYLMLCPGLMGETR